MATRVMSLVFGVLYLVLGICGFVPQWVASPPARVDFREAAVIGGYGFLFGGLPVNIVHNLVYILIGAAGLLTAIAGREAATAYQRATFAVMVAFVFLGILPDPVNRLAGLMPLFHWNIMIHTWTAAAAWYFGMIYPVSQRRVLVVAE